MLSLTLRTFLSITLVQAFIEKVCGNCGLTWKDDALCDGFNSWQDLNTLLNNSVFSANSSRIDIHPAKPIILTDDLDIRALFYSFQSNFLITGFNYVRFAYNLIGINGIDMMPWTSNDNITDSLSLELIFVQSQIEFYTNGYALTNYTCSRSLISSFKSIYLPKTVSFFEKFSKILFQNQNTYPSELICPYVFLNSSVSVIGIYNQIDAILVKNMFRFHSISGNRKCLIDN
jgi:hypothetical protein